MGKVRWERLHYVFNPSVYPLLTFFIGFALPFLFVALLFRGLAPQSDLFECRRGACCFVAGRCRALALDLLVFFIKLPKVAPELLLTVPRSTTTMCACRDWKPDSSAAVSSSREMKKVQLRIAVALLVHAVAWFLPVVKGEVTFPHGLPGYRPRVVPQPTI